MNRTDISIRLSGDAGQGLESSGAGFVLAAARAGLHVMGTPDYRSRVRGGNNFFQVRLGDSPLYGQSDKVHVLIALTGDAVQTHASSVMDGGVVLVPGEVAVDASPLEARNISLIQPPLVELAKQHGDRQMANTGLLGSLAALIGFPLQPIEDVIQKNFARKGDELVAANHAVAEEAHRMAEGMARDIPWKVTPPPNPVQRMAIAGNHALALGALAGGCRFQAAYPMTPATTIIEWLSSLPPEYGMVTKHAEDEIAAICMAIGASYTGARAMTATSGGGFCLMVEALGLAGMTEVPVVVVNAQRGGPSTGLPTRTEQGDLLFSINAGHGEFPRVVLAPRSHEECFELGWRAFNLADRYQCPVIVLTDMVMAGTIKTVEHEDIDFSGVTIDRGKAIEAASEGYKRFEFTQDGISPRAFPGDPNAVFATSTDEHDEHGHITEDADNRVRMMQKRMQKLATAAAEARPPDLYGPPGAEITLVAWGSTCGPCREAVDAMNADAPNAANLVSLTDLWPLAPSTEDELRAHRRLISVEANYSSQLARLLRMETGVSVGGSITRYDGRPFTGPEIARQVKEEQSAAV